MTEIRDIRRRLGLSQRALAVLIDVAEESVRAWDSGRRTAPAAVLARLAQELGKRADPATVRPQPTVHEERPPVPPSDDLRLLSLPALAGSLGVSVYTLRGAVREGTLRVTYDTRTTYGRPIPRATLSDALAYQRGYYGRARRKFAVAPVPPILLQAPDGFDLVVARLRRNLRLTQSAFAKAIGAAGKAVVYQWESRKRRPSPILWARINALVTISQHETPSEG